MRRSTVLLSAGRFSSDLSHLAKAQRIVRDLDLHLIVVLRDEVALVRSMYLQSVKSYFAKPGKRFALRKDFAEWWQHAHGRFEYGRMIRQWTDAYGENNISYVAYVADQDRGASPTDDLPQINAPHA